MSYVVSLTGITPSPRYDNVPWTQLVITEGPLAEGPWTPVQTITFTDPDADPRAPAERDITITEASMSSGWYQLVFVDAAGGQDVPRFQEWPPPNMTVDPVPTLYEMRARSMLLASRYPAPGGDAALQMLRDDACALVSNLTGRDIGVSGQSLPGNAIVCSEGFGWDAWSRIGCGDWLARLQSVPGRLVQIAKRAITLKCERLSVGSCVRDRVNAANTSLIKSFSAGSYSQTSQTVGDIRKSMMLDPDPALDEALRQLITEDGWAIWLYLATGQEIPAAMASSFDGLKVPGGYERSDWLGRYG